jgi:putative membrane protein
MERRSFLVGIIGVLAASPVSAASRRPRGDFRSLDLMTGGLALESSNIALRKLSSGEVVRFAQAEVAEQTHIALTLDAAPGLSPLDGRALSMLARLERISSGRDFERAYVIGQIDGHRKLLALNETELKTNGEYSRVASMSLPLIRQHLTTLMSLRETA